MSDPAPSWIIDVVDSAENPLTDAGLVDYDLAEFTFQDTGNPDLFACTVPLDSETARAIIAPEITNERDVYIRGYRTPTGSELDRELKFYGAVRFDQVLGAQKRLAFVAASPDVILQQRFTLAQFAPMDLGLLVKEMVDDTNADDGETGILTDAAWITASSTIDLDARQNKPSIASMIAQFAGMLDGVECWTEPMELSAGKIARLYAAPSRGGSSDAVFAFGAETDANCLDMTQSRDRAKVENDVRAFSDALTSAAAVDAVSVAALRRLVALVSMTGETNQSVLDARAQGRLQQRSTLAKVAEYTCVPDTNAPRLFDDYEIGDSVGVYFREGFVEWDVSQRVRLAKIAIDIEGNERPSGVEFRGLAS